MAQSQDIQATRELVETYIRFFGKSARSTEELKPLLDSQVVFSGPLGTFHDAEAFLQDVKQDKLLIDSLNVHEIIVDGEKACARYEVTSKDPDIGTVRMTEWFETAEGRIRSIISIYDATSVKTAYTRI
jgi:hypothetical protein